jgi:outer membrane immunogenic protein
MMKLHTTLLSVALAFITYPALADELSLESAHNWRGLYVGGFLGGSISNKSDATSCAASSFSPCKPSSDGYATNGKNDLSHDAHSSESIMGGAQMGYNWQVEHPKGYRWIPNVFGIEAEWGRLHYKESIGGLSEVAEPAQYPGYLDYTTTLKNYGFIGGRVGYAVDKVLVYFKGGAVFTDMKSKLCSAPEKSCLNGRPGTTDKSTGAGYALGGGLEYALNAQWSIKAEYLMMNLPSMSTTGTGTTYGVPPEIWPLGFAMHQTMDNFHTAKVGLNYHF